MGQDEREEIWCLGLVVLYKDGKRTLLDCGVWFFVYTLKIEISENGKYLLMSLARIRFIAGNVVCYNIDLYSVLIQFIVETSYEKSSIN